MTKEGRYASVPLPRSLAQRIDHLVKELGYWPSRTAFVREACLEKIEKYKAELEGGPS